MAKNRNKFKHFSPPPNKFQSRNKNDKRNSNYDYDYDYDYENYSGYFGLGYSYGRISNEKFVEEVYGLADEVFGGKYWTVESYAKKSESVSTSNSEESETPY